MECVAVRTPPDLRTNNWGRETIAVVRPRATSCLRHGKRTKRQARRANEAVKTSAFQNGSKPRRTPQKRKLLSKMITLRIRSRIRSGRGVAGGEGGRSSGIGASSEVTSAGGSMTVHNSCEAGLASARGGEAGSAIGGGSADSAAA